MVPKPSGSPCWPSVSWAWCLSIGDECAANSINLILWHLSETFIIIVSLGGVRTTFDFDDMAFWEISVGKRWAELHLLKVTAVWWNYITLCATVEKDNRCCWNNFLFYYSESHKCIQRKCCVSFGKEREVRFKVKLKTKQIPEGDTQVRHEAAFRHRFLKSVHSQFKGCDSSECLTSENVNT